MYMKHTYLGFKQQKLLEYGLDATDATILRYFIDFKDTDKMVHIVINNQPFYWVKYEGIIQEYPLLGLKSADSVYRRLKKLVGAGLLKHETVKNKGTYSFYGVGDNYLSLISDTEITKKNTCQESQSESTNQSDENPIPVGNLSEGVRISIRGGTDFYPEQNIHLLKYPSTKNITKEKVKKKTEIDELIESFTADEKLQQTIYEFVKMRKGIKAAITTLGLKKLLNRLNQIAASDSQKIAVLDQSIMNSWKGIFPLKSENKNNAQYASNTLKFNNCKGRDYDYDALEKKLLGWDED